MAAVWLKNLVDLKIKNWQQFKDLLEFGTPSKVVFFIEFCCI
jgi:hypothetical protein